MHSCFDLPGITTRHQCLVKSTGRRQGRREPAGVLVDVNAFSPRALKRSLPTGNAVWRGPRKMTLGGLYGIFLL
jgi:hypothetical protein